ncbi:hypothetical protein LCGC14_2906670 [marine sediment metagenome]|uniref:Uncharacterized protein n=1 Tax=marine sediment metagenome TaxID=412755 RepID=A0A0F9AIZ9_9ZZZZ
MKQHITTGEAHIQLKNKQYDKVCDWLKKKGYIIEWKNKPNDGVLHSQNIAGELVFINTGQMIEFLDERYGCRFDILKIIDEPKYGRNGYAWVIELKGWVGKENQELCDALWEAVKEILKG